MKTVSEDMVAMKYKFIQDFINLKDEDKVNKILLYFSMITSNDDTTKKSSNIMSLYGALSGKEGEEFQKTITEARKQKSDYSRTIVPFD